MSAITITFGDCAENNPGMQQLGQAAEEGFTYEDLRAAKRRFEAAGCACELVDLVSAGGVETLGEGARGEEEGPEPAYVLIVRRGVDALLGAPGAAGAMRDEQRALPADEMAVFRGEVKRKRARHNLCFGDESQEPDYEAGRGRVVAFGDVPHTAAARGAIGRFFGAKGADLLAEGNYYYRPAVCGIGFHGDGERRKVVALRLGAAIPLHYQWFLRCRPAGYRVVLALGHGDLYAMSEKAVGHDWRRPSIPTLRHAAGARKYLTIKDHPAVQRPALRRLALGATNAAAANASIAAADSAAADNASIAADNASIAAEAAAETLETLEHFTAAADADAAAAAEAAAADAAAEAAAADAAEAVVTLAELLAAFEIDE